MDGRLAAAIKRLGQTYIPGSSATRGYLYNPLPFPGCEDIPCHRPNSPERWEIIRKHTDFTGKWVFDLGCATGYFSFKANQAGAEFVHGIDHDVDAIKVCRAASEVYNVQNVAFNHHTLASFRLAFDEAWNGYEIGFAMSILNWLGQKWAETWLNWFKNGEMTVWVEIPLAGDGRGGATWIKDTKSYLLQWFSKVDNCGITAGPHRGKPRPLYRCSND